MPEELKDENGKKEESRQMLRDIHLVIKGNKELKILGMLDHQEVTNERLKIIDEKLDRDHSLLLPNRVLFGFFELVKRPLAWLLALAVIAGLYGISIAEFIGKTFGITK